MVHVYVALYVVVLPALSTSAMFGPPGALVLADCVEPATDPAVAVGACAAGDAAPPHAASAIAAPNKRMESRIIWPLAFARKPSP